MYTVIASIGVSKEPYSRWQALNLSSFTVEQIFNAYRKVYLTLTAGFLTEPVFVDMDVFRLKYLNFQGTLADMFLDNNTDTFETIEEIPVLETKRAYYSDAVRAGYKINTSNQLSTGEIENLDLKLSRPNTDINELYNHCMFTVNGFFHMSDKDSNYVYLLNGGNTMLKSRENHVGIWSWLNVAPIKHVKITENMLFKQHDESTFSDRAIIKINEDTTNKTVLLVAGGYLVRPEKEIFYPIGNDTFCFNIGRIPMLRRYFESRDFIDFSSMGLDSSSVNDSLISLEQFYSDEKITKYLTLPQSFLVIIDKEDIYFEQHFIKHTNLPGMFITYYDPVYPLFVGAGRAPEYWKRQENAQWSVNVSDSYRQNKAFETALAARPTHVSTVNRTTKIFFNSKGYLLEAGSDY
jgi:hypothetical protein